MPTPERITLASPILQRAKHLARLEDVSLSELVTRAIQAYQPEPVPRPRKTNAREERWEQMFVRLAKYKAVHGDCNVRERYPEDPQLASWVRRQRWRKRRGTLRKDRKKRLSALGLAWEPRETGWDKRLAELRAFHAVHGHCNVPRTPEYIPLCAWVGHRRRERDRGRLSAERIAQLDSLGFTWWETGTRLRDRWEMMLGRLKAYKASHGHCYVPLDWPEDPQLGRWVSGQRLSRRKGKLSQERFEKLTALGFDSEPLKNRHRMRRRKVQRAVPESTSHEGA